MPYYKQLVGVLLRNGATSLALPLFFMPPLDIVFLVIAVILGTIAAGMTLALARGEKKTRSRNELGHLQPDTHWKCVVSRRKGKTVLLMGPCAVTEGDAGLYVEIQDLETKRIGYLKADKFLDAYTRLTPIQH